MNKIYMLFLVCSVLSGCASAIDVYNPSKSLPTDLATVRSEDNGAWIGAREFSTTISRGFDTKGNIVVEGNFWSGDLTAATLAPGEYQFIVKCYKDESYNYHHVDIYLEPSNQYTAYCLGRYEDGFLGDYLKGMLGFISNNKELKKDKLANQLILDSLSAAE